MIIYNDVIRYRTHRGVYAPLAIWWPQHFNSGQAPEARDDCSCTICVYIYIYIYIYH